VGLADRAADGVGSGALGVLSRAHAVTTTSNEAVIKGRAAAMDPR